MVGKTFVGIDFGTSTTVVSIASYDAVGDLYSYKILQIGTNAPGWQLAFVRDYTFSDMD